MRLFNQFLSLIFLLTFSFSAHAQLLTESNRLAGRDGTSLSASLSFTEIEYEVDGAGSAEVERTIIGASGSYGFNDYLDFYGELGFISEAEISGGDSDTGFLIGGGLKGILYEDSLFTILGRGGVRYISEEYSSIVDADIFEVDLGLTGRYDIHQTVSAYIGADIFPFSDGELDSGRAFDLEREDLVGLRLGADYKMNDFIVNAEFGLVSEVGFIIRLGIPL